MTKAFISYHHENDREYKEHLSWLAREFGVFQDVSLPVTGIPDDGRSSESIRREIRDECLRDSEVTILLCGTETKGRKHIDWELKSSMIHGRRNPQSGILVINLPGVGGSHWTAALPGEKSAIYPDYGGGWTSIMERWRFEEGYPLMPTRIIDNLLNPRAKVSVVPWDRVEKNPEALRWLVDSAAVAGRTNVYDLSRKMRRNNSARVEPTLGDLLAASQRSTKLGSGLVAIAPPPMVAAFSTRHSHSQDRLASRVGWTLRTFWPSDVRAP